MTSQGSRYRPTAGTTRATAATDVALSTSRRASAEAPGATGRTGGTCEGNSRDRSSRGWASSPIQTFRRQGKATYAVVGHGMWTGYGGGRKGTWVGWWRRLTH